jgi:DNA-3-methyladenine glycosylase I
MTSRCQWCGDDPLYVDYHDREWGVPVHDDRHLFEFLILEGAQAGLSWITILRKRDNYRRAMDGFNIAAVAAYGEADVARLLADSGIVRNRLKIRAAITNAKAVLAIQKEFGSFSEYLWGFVDHRPLCNSWRTQVEMPARTALSDAISKDLKKRGCSFVGSTIIYSLMQATGMVNDHVVDCFRHREIASLTDKAT